MRRREFVGWCASGVVAASVPMALTAQTGSSARGGKAISALNAAKEFELNGDFTSLQKAFHSDALRVEPSTLDAQIGRAAITDSLRKAKQERKLLYFYYRQPQFLQVGNSVLVVSNYEAGYDSGGQTLEETGKTSSVVLVGPNPALIAQEVIVPNLYAGSYGALGTALTSRHLGIYPIRALGPATTTEAKSAGGGENDVLYSQVRSINNAWVTGNPDDILRSASKAGVFLIGDYSPFYISGADAVKRHFADFYKTSKVNSLKSLDPQVRIWGDTAAVYFNFDLDYDLAGKSRRSPGRAAYTFVRGGGGPTSWKMAVCTASHLVAKSIGDPYPLAAGPS